MAFSSIGWFIAQRERMLQAPTGSGRPGLQEDPSVVGQARRRHVAQLKLQCSHLFIEATRSHLLILRMHAETARSGDSFLPPSNSGHAFLFPSSALANRVSSTLSLRPEKLRRELVTPQLHKLRPSTAAGDTCILVPLSPRPAFL